MQGIYKRQQKIKFVLMVLFIPFILFAKKPDLLLLKTYKDQNINSWVMSEKLDGIRAYWDGKKLYFRSGKIINAPIWFTAHYPPFELDGELWTKRADFENISSIVRDKIPNETQWHTITHNIFEVPNAKGNLYKRLANAKPYQNSIIKIIPQVKVKDKQHLQQYLKQIETLGGEGVVVRDPKALYINKRTSKALKVKNFKDAECTVIGYTKGKGKFTNMIGAIKCKLKNGIIFKIGSGLNKQDRINPPKIGDTITFKYKEFTKYGKPKFSSYLRIRYKKDTK